MLREKNQNIALYGAFLLIGLTKGLKLVYCNIDQLTTLKKQPKSEYKMSNYEKIYGQQSFLTCSEIKIMPNKTTATLAQLREFRMVYIQRELQKTFDRDTILHNMLGHNGPKAMN
jgi:hypothetical protein